MWIQTHKYYSNSSSSLFLFDPVKDFNNEIIDGLVEDTIGALTELIREGKIDFLQNPSTCLQSHPITAVQVIFSFSFFKKKDC